jgi:hypothetical protein
MGKSDEFEVSETVLDTECFGLTKGPFHPSCKRGFADG